jgi:carbamate kinase
VDRVSKDFGTSRETPLPQLSVEQARRLLREGQFPPGSMGPKIDAACLFIEAGGREVLITRAESLEAALAGETGTVIRERV